MSHVHPAPSSLAPLMKNGCLTMVALDQRGSLRTIIANGRDESQITDQDLVNFKSTAAKVLTPLASAVLLDGAYGREAMKNVAPGVGLILSADLFTQRPGGPVEKAVLDPQVTPAFIEECNAVAIKLLVVWTAGKDIEFRRDVVGRFVELARKTGKIALVEGLVRDEHGQRFTDAREHGEAVIEAAHELVQGDPDIYKAEVPGYVPGQFEQVPGYAKRLTETIKQPWIVLSSGVVPADFTNAVRLCCENGASGFLAGRAIWADAASKSNLEEELRRESLPRLRELIEVVRSARGLPGNS